MKKIAAWYACVESGIDCRYEALILPGELDSVAAMEVAEDFYNNHDGWEAEWPLTFALYGTEDGPEVSRYLVELEHAPHFLAWEKATPKVVP